MIFKRSVVSELMNTAGGVFTVLYSIVFTVGTVRVLSNVAGGKYDAGSIFQLMLYTSLMYIAPIIAFSLFVAILMTLMRSWQQNEMVVWFSSGGLSLAAWIQPVLKFSIPVVLLTVVLSLLISPWAREQLEISKEQYSHRDDTTKVASGQFVEAGEGGQVFFLEQMDEVTGSVKGVFLTQAQGGKRMVIVSKEGRLSVNEEGDRYVTLTDGRRYEIAPKAESYRETDFESYSVRLDVKPDQIFSSQKSQALPTSMLLADPKGKNAGQLFWRLAWPFVALNLALLAIPLSYTNPRQGRSLNLVIAILAFILYLNMISIVQTWVEEGRYQIIPSMAVLHGAVFCITVVFFIRRVWLERWLPRQVSIGYWRERLGRNR